MHDTSNLDLQSLAQHIFEQDGGPERLADIDSLAQQIRWGLATQPWGQMHACTLGHLEDDHDLVIAGAFPGQDLQGFVFGHWRFVLRHLAAALSRLNVDAADDRALDALEQLKSYWMLGRPIRLRPCEVLSRPADVLLFVAAVRELYWAKPSPYLTLLKQLEDRRRSPA